MSKKGSLLEIVSSSAGALSAGSLGMLWCKLQDSNIYILNTTRQHIEEAIVAKQIPEIFAKGTFVLNDEAFTIGAATTAALFAGYTVNAIYNYCKGNSK